MSTPFDVESATFLSELVAVYKIASADLTNRPFIEHICSFGKPILLSTGASDLAEIHRTLGWIERGFITSYWSYRMSHNQFGQWRDNERVLAGLPPTASTAAVVP